MEFDTSDVEIEVVVEIELDEIDILDIGRLETVPDAIPEPLEDNWCVWPRRAA